ncbi:MAG: iron-sulfur cluster assembly scaffold protein [Candidatus Woesearchaeota archaeon]|nr:iron-sulfur cluster assembly scaffold protein [Candidatus Woesearchaeota archaeon]
MQLEYTPEVIENFRNPKNVGEIINPSGEATEGSPACGDMVTMQILVKDDLIEDIKFKSYGCASNIATGSIVTEIAKGKSIEEAKKITWKSATNELGGLPPVKVHCSVLAVDTLKKAIEDYEIKNGKLKITKIVDLKSEILKELGKVVHAKYGDTIINLNLVKSIEEIRGVWLIETKIEPNDEFIDNIKEEIEEHLEPLNVVYKLKIRDK